MPAGAEHKSQGYRRAVATLRAHHRQPCCLCDGWIDYRLRAPDPGSFSAEHVVPVRLGGDWTMGLLPAHLGCQRQQGGLARVGKGQEYEGFRSSGVW